MSSSRFLYGIKKCKSFFIVSSFIGIYETAAPQCDPRGSFLLHRSTFLCNKKEPITHDCWIRGYRLCVCASGSLIIDILNCFTVISVSCLHFGQNKGKFSNTVFSCIFTLVLLLQTGHKIHCSFILIPFPVPVASQVLPARTDGVSRKL